MQPGVGFGTFSKCFGPPVYRHHGALTELAIRVGPRVRIRLAPAGSLRTIGTASEHANAIRSAGSEQNALAATLTSIAATMRGWFVRGPVGPFRVERLKNMTFTELSCELPDHAGWRQTASMLWPSGSRTNAP